MKRPSRLPDPTLFTAVAVRVSQRVRPDGPTGSTN
jgi:hypothetical protein